MPSPGPSAHPQPPVASGPPTRVRPVSTALYRRYRPDRFEEVIGQDHVTIPLRTALAKDRVSHAYLFSGPRGCGKTTSARILARCLNCAQGPTATPCGECDSCRDLATGGPGSLDVMEIDAASHGGVDDARGLRERATFAPVRDRYKILIIDEAHMVTAAGFNALLKIVEEPPEHLKFIFATTEPEKVIGTIRSRTHHYPFRLVPPEPLIAYLEQMCAEEQVRVEPGVLPLVVRAGTGSVRDTLSVLDQLIAGADQGSVSYELAVNLLGFTPEALLDDVIDAIAADDTPTVFRVVDRVVQSGQDPRRFVEDLLDRFRDLVIARALPDEAGSILHGMPDDQVRRLAAQAAQLSRAELSRLADVTNLALSEMVGATSPRLHLELLMARLVLPATDDTHRGISARLEALERRLEFGGAPTAEAGAATTPAAATTPRVEDPRPNAPGAAGLSGAALARAAARRPENDAEPQRSVEDSAPAHPTVGPVSPTPAVAAAPAAGLAAVAPATEAPVTESPVAEVPAAAPTPAADPSRGPAGSPAPEQWLPAQDAPASSAGGAAPPAAQDAPANSARPPAEAPAPAQAPAAPAAGSVEMVRRAWPDILAALEDSSRLIWMLVKDNASVTGYDGSLLTIGFAHDGPRQSLLGRRGDQVLAEAVHRVLGIRPELDLILGGDAPRAETRAPAGRPNAATGRQAAPAPAQEQQAPASRPAREDAPAAAGRDARPQGQQPVAAAPGSPVTTGQAGPRRPAQPATAWPAPPSPAAGSAPAQSAPPQSAPQQSARPSASPRPGSPAASAPAAPATDGWGRPDEEPPAWDDAPPPEEDPWDSLPEFDPDSDIEDSPGPEGWVPPSGTESEDADTPTGTPGWDGPVPSSTDWGTPPQGARPETSSTGSGMPDASGTLAERLADGAPAPSGESDALPTDVSPEAVRRAYDPGPLVPPVEPSIPVFARPEAELRAEFEARFGGTRPTGFDAGARGGAPEGRGGDRSTRGQSGADGVASSSRGDDGVPPGQGDDPAASEREDPHPAASAAEISSAAHPDSTGSPTSDGTPDPGVPAEHHERTESAAAESPAGTSADGRSRGQTPARGSGHPASMFPRLMERLEAGGPLEPPVNAPDTGGTSSTDGVPDTPAPDSPPSPSTPSGRPSAAALGARTGAPDPAGSSLPPAPPAMDPRAAAIRAAREAAQGRGPAPAQRQAAASAGPAVGWADEVASEDDVALEDSGLVGRAVVERVLGGRLLEERAHEPVR